MAIGGSGAEAIGSGNVPQKSGGNAENATIFAKGGIAEGITTINCVITQIDMDSDGTWMIPDLATLECFRDYANNVDADWN